LSATDERRPARILAVSEAPIPSAALGVHAPLAHLAQSTGRCELRTASSIDLPPGDVAWCDSVVLVRGAAPAARRDTALCRGQLCRRELRVLQGQGAAAFGACRELRRGTGRGGLGPAARLVRWCVLQAGGGGARLTPLSAGAAGRGRAGAEAGIAPGCSSR
jgi:hypothetical protein